MKKFCISAVILVLTAAMVTGCGCRNSKPAATTMPTTMPTVMTTEPVTEAPTTMPTTMPTQEPTLEDGNGPLSTDETTDTGAAGDSARSGITGSITGSK